MKKILVVFMTLLMICGCSVKEDVINVIRPDEAEPEEVQANGVWVCTAVHNDEGETSTYRYNEKGSLIKTSEAAYIYDSNGNLKAEILFADYDDGHMWGLTLYDYDEKNRLIKEQPMEFVMYSPRDIDAWGYYTYEYLEDGTDRIKKKGHYDPNNLTGGNWSVSYEYYDDGYAIGDSEIHTLNEKGNDILVQYINKKKPENNYSISYEYAEDGETLLKKTDDSKWGGGAWITEYEYPEPTLMIEKHSSIDSNSVETEGSSVEYYKDEHGNTIREVRKNADGTVDYETTYDYRFIDFDHPEENSSSDEPLFTAKIKYNDINIRTSPTTQADNIVGTVNKGETYKVYEALANEGYLWYRIGEDKWIADKNTTWTTLTDKQ
ncbi:MAG: SH3 domain-containing protein [Erysipelotrichaceae bacterium]|nr:SH3 domain-containing protein [Erysipelotrichaceae bacterium]